MRLLFAEPPPARRIGGIDTALNGLSTALRALGHEVVRWDKTLPAPALKGVHAVHFHGLWETSHHPLRLACRAARLPFLVSPHGMLEPWAMHHKSWKKSLYFRWRERPTLRPAARLLATSEDEARGIRRYLPHAAVAVIPLGFDPPPPPAYAAARTALGWSPTERVVVFLSRLHEKKGLHLLVEAWPRVAVALPGPSRLVIVGEGDPSYVSPLRSRNLPHVDWIGPCWGDAKWPYLQGADVFCLPSFSENFGFVVLEAVACGTPALTTPGTPWGTLRGGLPITLCEPTTTDVMLALIDATLAVPPTAAQRADTHANALARFGWPALAPDYAALYATVTASA